MFDNTNITLGHSVCQFKKNKKLHIIIKNQYPDSTQILIQIQLYSCMKTQDRPCL